MTYNNFGVNTKNSFNTPPKKLKLFSVKVEILVEAVNADSARDIIENIIDDAQSSNDAMQDYRLYYKDIKGV